MRSVSAAEALEHYGAAFLSSFDDNDSEAEAHVAHTSTHETLSNLERHIGPLELSSSGDSSKDDTPQTSNASEPVPVFEFRDSAVVRQGGTRHASISRATLAGGSRNKAVDSASVVVLEDTASWSGSKAELAALQRQVQTYGAGALDKKRRKQYNKQQLAELGLKAPKAQKMAAAVGKGLKQVHVKREHKATEAAIEAGHLSRKSVSKQHRKQRQTARKPGSSLREDNGAFVGGVMHIRKAGGKSGFLRQKRESRA